MMKFDNTLLYQKVKSYIRQRILDTAEFEAEVRLDAERKMAEDLGVSRFSINKAISELVVEGYLIKRRGIGVFIPPKEQLATNEHQLKVLALILPNLHGTFYGKLSKEIEQLAYANGFKIMISLIGYDAVKEKDFLTSIQQNRSIGGILAAPNLDTDNFPLYTQLHQSGIPVVFISRIHESMRSLPHIVYDKEQGSYQATRHLYEQGKKNLLFIGYEKRYLDLMRKQGFDRVIEELDGMQGFEIYMVEPDFENKLINLIEHQHIDGILAFNDILATRAMNILINHGYKVPEDIGMIGFDNSDLAEIALVPLTSVNFDKEKLAHLAFETILHLLQGSPCQTEHIIPTTLAIRGSTVVQTLEG